MVIYYMAPRCVVLLLVYNDVVFVAPLAHLRKDMTAHQTYKYV